MKNEKKIRKLLGSKYHLCSNNDGEWILYRMYDDPEVYFSNVNKAIMSYETNTEEELYKYLKQHHEWNLSYIINQLLMIIFFVIWILSIINIFKHNNNLRIIIASSFLPSMIIMITKSIVSLHNSKVFYIEMKDTLKRLEDENSKQ